MTDTPQAVPLQPSNGQGVNGAEVPPDHDVADVLNQAVEGRPADSDPLPSPEALHSAMIDGSGNAVSSQPFDTDVADLQEARHRVTWDADTDGRAPTQENSPRT